MILILCILQLIFIAMVWLVRERFNKFERELSEIIWREMKISEKRHEAVSHDLQQIKTRLHWSREREIENEKFWKDIAQQWVKLEQKIYNENKKKQHEIKVNTNWALNNTKDLKLKIKKLTKKGVNK